MLLVAGHQPPALAVSNNNSICHAFQTSPAHAHLCEPFCGAAFDRALDAGAPVHYRCHAGLNCFAMPVRLNTAPPLAVIGGRAFLRSADYRALAERIRTGDLADLLTPELFHNVIFASRQDLDELAARVGELAGEFGASLPTKATARRRSEALPEESEREAATTTAEAVEEETATAVSEHLAGAAEAAIYPRYFPPGVTLKDACRSAVEQLANTYKLESLALMLRVEEGFAANYVTGKFVTQHPRVSLKAKEIKLLQAATHGESIAVPVGGRTSSRHEDAAELFPLMVGVEIKGALLVGDKKLDDAKRHALADFLSPTCAAARSATAARGT